MSGRSGDFGSIRERNNGWFQGLYFDATGRRHSVGTFRTKGEARAALNAVQTDMSRAVWIDPTPGRELFGTYAKRILNQREHEVAPRTLDQYRSLLKQHLSPAFGSTPISRIEKSQVRAWHADLAARRPGAAAAAYRLLKAILNRAVEDEIIPRNPCKIRGAGTDRSAERVPPSTDQVWKLMEAMPDELKATVVIACAVPIRRNEVLGLQRRDIDFDKGTLRVERQLEECPGRYWPDLQYRPTKTGESNAVHLSDEVLSVLKRHMDAYVSAAPTSPLFPAKNGQPLRPGSFYRQWDAARKSVGLSQFRFHDLRHYAATMLASSGASVAELKYRGRWKSNLMPLRYQHASTERDAQLAEATSKYVPLPIPVELPLAPNARPVSFKTTEFELDDALTRDFVGQSSEGETRTLNLAVNSRLLCH
jgi:integrase